MNSVVEHTNGTYSIFVHSIGKLIPNVSWESLVDTLQANGVDYLRFKGSLCEVKNDRIRGLE